VLLCDGAFRNLDDFSTGALHFNTANCLIGHSPRVLLDFVELILSKLVLYFPNIHLLLALFTFDWFLSHKLIEALLLETFAMHLVETLR
jgi:hypothetical protein